MKEVAYRVLGTWFAVRAPRPIRAELDRLLAPFRLPLHRPAPGFILVVRSLSDGYALEDEAVTLLRAAGPDRLLPRLVAEVNRRAVEGFRGFAVHAAVVARDGAAIALPGGSGSGKSTLAAACALEGFTYVSDEALCLDFETGLVIPYPKPIALGPHSLRLLGLSDGKPGGEEVLVAPADLGAEMAGEPLPLGWVILPRRDPGGTRLEPLPGQRAMADLLRYSFNHYRRPEASFRLAAQQARASRTLSLTYQDPRRAARLLWEATAPEGPAHSSSKPPSSGSGTPEG